MTRAPHVVALVVAAVVALVGASACGDEQSARDLCDEGLCAPGTLTFGARAASFTRSTVEAVAITPDEPPWFAGTFDSDITIDDVSLPWDGAGYRDTFLARTGVPDLAPLVADDSAAYPQRVVGVVPDAEDGALVFAIGQQEDTRHRFTAAWYERHGQRVVGGTVAVLDAVGTLGGASVTRDARGWPIVAASGTRLDLDGDIHDGARAIVMRLGQGLRREILIELAGVDIADLSVDGDLLAIAGSYSGAPAVPDDSAPWPQCAAPEPCGFVAAIALSSGRVSWVQPIRAPGGAAVHAVAAGSGQVIGMASAAGAASDPPLGTGALPAYLVTLDAAGASGQPVLLDQTILAEAGTTIGARDLAIADGGAVIVALAYRGEPVLVGSQAPAYMRADDSFASVVAELGTDLIWQWQAYLIDDNMQVTTVATRGDQVAFGGIYRGAFSLFNPLDVETPAPTDVDNGFVLEVHR